ncbi:MAG TPA: polysaccharide biosynthesis tyrosine autokinase [Acidimicrobiales bacterium]|nr:polysaccharide biosynthesis tyrosine autokinase [Acidimicrobiales bacterium]
MSDTGTGSPQLPNFLDSARTLWRRKLLILLVLVVAVAATFGLDRTRHKEYQSTASVYFLAQGVNSTAVDATSLSTQQLSTDVALVQSTPVRVAASKILGRVAPTLDVQLLGSTQVADLTVQSTSPAFAARAANAYAQAYIERTRKQFVDAQLASEAAVQSQINTLQTQINAVQAQLSQTASNSTQTALQAQLTGLYQQQSALKTQLSQLQLTTAQSSAGAQVVQAAVPTTTPSSPKTVRDLGIAGVAGLLVGCGFALLRDNLDDRIRSKVHLESATRGLPVLGLIPRVSGWRDHKAPYLVGRELPNSPPAEAYRGLRTSIQFMSVDDPIKTLQITSPSARDGKTTTSANFAWIMAESGQRVVLISCDLRRPRVHEFFGLSNSVGFVSVLLGTAELADALVAVEDQPNLLVLPSGPIPPNPSELLSSRKTKQLLAEISAMADIVILDSAPLLPVTDGAVLSAHADAVLLVVAAERSRRRDVLRAAEMMDQINAPIIGTVLNQAPEADSDANYKRGYYNYGYSSRTGGGSKRERGRHVSDEEE